MKSPEYSHSPTSKTSVSLCKICIQLLLIIGQLRVAEGGERNIVLILLCMSNCINSNSPRFQFTEEDGLSQVDFRFANLLKMGMCWVSRTFGSKQPATRHSHVVESVSILLRARTEQC